MFARESCAENGRGASPERGGGGGGGGRSGGVATLRTDSAVFLNTDSFERTATTFKYFFYKRTGDLNVIKTEVQ